MMKIYLCEDSASQLQAWDALLKNMELYKTLFCRKCTLTTFFVFLVTNML